MVAPQKPTESGRSRRAPATTPEARENQLVGLAVDLAERQLTDGTASAQVITHFLKLASSTEKLAQDKLRNENELLKSKVEAMASGKRVEELYSEALVAMSTYQGRDVVMPDD